MRYFTSSNPIFDKAAPRFESRDVTNHRALLFHLLSELQRNGPRAIFGSSTVSDVEKFFRAMLGEAREVEDQVDHTYWEEGVHTLSSIMQEAVNSRTVVRYSAPVVALYLDAFTHCRYYDNCVSNEVLTQMVIASHPWWRIRCNGEPSGSEIEVTRKRIVGKLRNRCHPWLRVDVPIEQPWRRGPLWD